MTELTRHTALTKLAFYGYAGVPGIPVYPRPMPTVGQLMYLAKAPKTNIPGMSGRDFTDSVIKTNVNVNAPAKSLLNAGIGALAGNFIANTLKTGPFMRGIMTAAGASYGYNR